MEWLTLALSALTALLSTATVLLVWRLDSRGEQRRWLRDARMKAALALKAEVSKVRDRHSPNGKPDLATRFGRDSGFASVNTAMAEVELLCSEAVRGEISLLRSQLRDFVRASRDEASDWRVKRDTVDETVASILLKIREELR